MQESREGFHEASPQSGVPPEHAAPPLAVSHSDARAFMR
jgi:hypothetical protein